MVVVNEHEVAQYSCLAIHFVAHNFHCNLDWVVEEFRHCFHHGSLEMMEGGNPVTMEVDADLAYQAGGFDDQVEDLLHELIAVGFYSQSGYCFQRLHAAD